MIISCWTLFGEKIYKNPNGAWTKINSRKTDVGIIKEVLKRISLNDIQQEIALSLMSIIGEEYHELFLERLAPFDNGMNTTETIKTFENDPDLKEHMQLMLWYALMRCFLDAVYFYFGQKNNSSK